MRRYILALFLITGTALGSFFVLKKRGPDYERLQTGDIVFQYTGGEQGEAGKSAAAGIEGTLAGPHGSGAHPLPIPCELLSIGLGGSLAFDQDDPQVVTILTS